MKILVIGAGVIGITYGWQLSINGNDVTLFVRKGKRPDLERNGFQIECLDTRGANGSTSKVNFKPAIIDEVSTDLAFDLIIVAVNSNQISSILPHLKNVSNQTDILFFSNNWSGFDEIKKEIPAGKYFFGYPFKAGGGREGATIQSVIFGTPFTNTVIGELDGSVTPRVRQIVAQLKKAGMNPVVSKDIKGYLIAHYVWAAANVGAYIEAGDYSSFANNIEVIRKMYLAMREGFNVCRSRGVDPARISPTCFYYLPLAVLAPFTSRLYALDGMRRMFEGHVLHSPEEMRMMYYEVLNEGNEYGTPMPNYGSYRNAIDRFSAG